MCLVVWAQHEKVIITYACYNNGDSFKSARDFGYSMPAPGSGKDNVVVVVVGGGGVGVVVLS